LRHFDSGPGGTRDRLIPAGAASTMLLCGCMDDLRNPFTRHGEEPIGL